MPGWLRRSVSVSGTLPLPAYNECMHEPLDIAIVSMGCVYPDAPNPEALWDCVRRGHCSAADVPAERWGVDPAVLLHPQVGRLDAICSRRACVVPSVPTEHLPEAIREECLALDPAYHLTAAAGFQAWAAARTEQLRPERVAVILGNIVLPTAATTRFTLELAARRRRGEDQAPPFRAENRRAAGGPALFLSRALGLAGATFTLDAACASSLYAIKLAVDELRLGRADAVLAGGVSRPDLLFCQVGFNALHALSSRGIPAPFDAAGDGLVVGEGAGILCLKRRADAERHGDSILALLRGVGLSNDREGKLLAPSSEGQLRAMRQAYAQAGWRPGMVDLIECHATGTPLGDAVEFASLRTLWAQEPARSEPVVLGSCKSNFGHALTAAGAAGIIKTIQALRHGVLPPTANFVRSQPGIELDTSPFTILNRERPWPAHPSAGPRRAAVSAFGFGGINAHLLLEEASTPGRVWSTGVSLPPPVPESALPPVAIVGVGIQLGSLASAAEAAEVLLGGAAWPSPVDAVNFDAAAFRLPPNDAAALLPQQVVMMTAAAQARRSVRRMEQAAERTGIFLGVELDWNTTNFALRWRELDPAQREVFGPPLTADRTLGALASIIASRLARAWRVGGPCFTLAGDDQVGRDVLRVAIDQLQQGSIDQALVGTVDLHGDPRDLLLGQGRTEARRTEGAIAFYLKRLADAQADGDEIIAMLDTAAVAGHAPEIQKTGIWAGLNSPLLEVAWAALARWHRVREDANGRIVPWLEPQERRDRSVALPGGTISLRASAQARPLPSRRRRTFLVVAGTDPASTRTELERALAQAQGDLALWAARWHRETEDRRQLPWRLVLAGHDLAELRQQATSAAPQERFPGRLAFVFPGSGNGWPGLGRELLLSWPEVACDWEQRWSHLPDHWVAEQWSAQRLEELSVAEQILQQVSFGALVAELLRRLGVRPEASLGYSLGETTALVALGFWPDRDELARRLRSSPLFQSELAGECRAARRNWNLRPEEPVDWQAVLVRAPAAEVRRALAGQPRVYLLASTAPRECIVGGPAAGVRAALGTRWPTLPLPPASTVHCDLAASLAEEYRAFHTLPLTSVPGITLYSTAYGEPLELTSAAVAAALTATALTPIDFPRVVERAYADGVRLFVEIGPGASCTRMIGEILAGRPHLSLAVQPAESPELLEEAVQTLLALGQGWPTVEVREEPVEVTPSRQVVRVPLHREMAWLMPAVLPVSGSSTPAEEDVASSPGLLAPLLGVLKERAAAHEQYFRFQARWQDAVAPLARMDAVPAMPSSLPVRLDRAACLEFARGRISQVLGPQFAHVDDYPTRVRLPDEPLMLVDRILTIEGEPRSLSRGRVVTEHDVLPDAWYLDGGRMPTSITVESGQADLFLAGYLGIDERTRGLAVYRLLDAVVTFHDSLPRAGQTVRYDIKIDRFFQQGDAYLFHFQFDGTVAGRPLLTMRHGCAGFFTAAALAAGRGILAGPMPPRPGRGLADNERFHQPPALLDDRQVAALYAGDLRTALGPAFHALPLKHPATLPAGRFKLVDRIVEISLTGGRFGHGLVRGEAEVPANAWYLTCHFVDDQVMPGTLMYEGCLHTLRLFLLSLGWVGEAESTWAEPIPGVASRLKCRGQVTAQTRRVSYEVHLRQLGLEPEAFAIGDALMFADGKPIVEITDLSLRLRGVNREQLRSLWGKQTRPRPALFDRERILAFAVGKPSEAFGPPYAVFDSERVIARLPGPPYQFLDRIVAIAAEPWKLQAGGVVEAEYDVPTDAWYFAANRQPAMPFAVLLEVALQPCGWLAAYLGSALTSPVDLSFRNLGGSATVHREVLADAGTLTTQVTLTQVSSSGGMIIQHFDLAVRSAAGPILTGKTYFGFFTKAALAEQVGLREAAVQPLPSTLDPMAMPTTAPYPAEKLRMIDVVDVVCFSGGVHGLGFVSGRKQVDPEEWFFAAHFYQDPVQPGSLGLEAFLQLAKVWAGRRWGATQSTRFLTPVPGRPFEWTYRGQVIPGHREVQVQASITALDESQRLLELEGFLSVDGRPIYAMNGFTLQFMP
jgi:acyl transferase domain-containing protein/3-hydroxymyristoyl/3-hydroxydecanoyl-(acyl carrier protein) dehydratase